MQNNLREYDYHYYSEEKNGLSQKIKKKTKRENRSKRSNIRFDSKIEKNWKQEKKNKKNAF